MTYTCCEEKRRAAVAAHATLNGIDWLEVLDLDAPLGSPRQRTLLVRLLKPVPAGFKKEQVRILGGERIRNIRVEWVAAAATPPAATPPAEAIPAEQAFLAGLDEADHVLVVRTDSNGDHSTYRLRLALDVDSDLPPENFDPRLVEVAFSFKVECPSDFDCQSVQVCQDEPGDLPDIDYLAKDYFGFRRLMLDRLSRLIPGWQERSAADLGVALTEVLAYAADHLSYWQDAVATEAYLETARRRTSLRRHALLVDYAMHDGCNARVWLQVRVAGDAVALTQGEMRFYTRVPGAPDRITPDSRHEADALELSPLVFEPMHDARLYEAHNEFYFYTWGDQRCCLPAGATAATLRDNPKRRLRLRPGDVLIFREKVGPLSDEESDANPLHRHAVRLTRVHPEAAVLLDAGGAESDRAPGPLVLDPLTEGTASETAIVEIEWDEADALPFPLCLSSETDADHGSRFIEGVSVALGNIVLADHGLTIEGESFDPVPDPWLSYPPDRDAGQCETAAPVPIPPRFRPLLANGPLTRIGQVLKTVTTSGVAMTSSMPFDPEAPASQVMIWEMTRVLPVIQLQSGSGGTVELWEVRKDLLSSGAADRHFVVEAEHDGSAQLRFGDDVHGGRPDSGTKFVATYRVGNGTSGNVGADAIAHVVTSNGSIASVTNPLAARGGTDLETAEQVRRRAPQAFRTQERAVTLEDYATMTERLPGVQRAVANLRWTGSWHTVFVTVDRESGEEMDAAYTDSVHRHLDRYRMAGHDLRLDDPVYVSLEIDLMVCVASDYFRSDVREGLLEVLGSGTLPDGRRGAFHPDNFSFGQTVYLSPLYAAARQVPGVSSVEITRFQRQGQNDPKPLADEFMTLDQLEIARLDNDPNFPENGVLRLVLYGGK